MRTLGGLQFWADVYYFDHWRIQRHALRPIHRLLDPNNNQCHQGPQEECLAELARRLDNPKLQPSGTKPTVLLLHGIIRTRFSMNAMANRLRRDGYNCYCVSYPSTRLTIEEHADDLHQIISRLDEASEISFVCHSMGGLVVRRFLARYGDPRVRRMVMLGTPNRGAEKADLLKGVGPYKWVMGPAGQQLVTTPAGIIGQLPETIENVEFGIIAGGKGNGRGYSWVLQGDDDGTVTVESTKLPGARDFLCVPGLHTFLPDSKKVQEATATFLKQGYFLDAQSRNPLPTADLSPQNDKPN